MQLEFVFSPSPETDEFNLTTELQIATSSASAWVKEEGPADII
jgi:hypothetical protein